MSNLLNAIVQYLNQDLNKMEELNKELGEEITNLKQTKNTKKEDNKLLSLEEKLKRRIEERENRLESLRKEYVKVRDFTQEIYGERIKSVFKTYKLLNNLGKESKKLGLKAYHEDFRWKRDIKEKMYFNEDYQNRLGFHCKKTTISDSTKDNQLYIDIMIWIIYTEDKDDLTINVFSNGEYTNDNALSLETKKVIAICELAKVFEEFEKRINDCVEKILEEQ